MKFTVLLGKIGLYIFATLFAILLALLVNILLLYRSQKPDPLVCNKDINILASKIKDKFNADTVYIETIKIREEIYFNEISSPIIIISNPTMETIDFKTSLFDMYNDDIRFNLKQELLPFAQSLKDFCDISKFNDIIIHLKKVDDDDDKSFMISYHFRELIK